MVNRKYINNFSEAPLSVCETANSFLQSAFWGEFKAFFAWKPYAFCVDWMNFEKKTPVLALYRKLIAGVGFVYVPWGPELPDDFFGDNGARAEALFEIAYALKPFLPHDTAFIRFDPPWFGSADEPPPLILKPFVRASADIQPPDTAVVDLAPPPDEILARMKSKWRYNIRLGGKKTSVFRVDVEGLEAFYALYNETAARDGIAIHGIGYYRQLFDLAKTKTSVDLRLYLAKADGDPVAGIITLFRGKTATYLYGASSNKNRNLMAAYALQWQAMLDAKKAGCIEYDLFGIPPDASPEHPMAGLYLFKTGFGGGIAHRPGSWDYVCKPIRAGIFRAAEKARKIIRDSRKHKTAHSHRKSQP
ncbi:MAG: peptidoglycan bridge formation glycyltransferase FemA/FemB family protein [Treponema sp.]|nr:peptidoglycan bridge formation glycyltransferase FemA/FemB family protein [Treponema sp.]